LFGIDARDANRAGDTAISIHRKAAGIHRHVKRLPDIEHVVLAGREAGAKILDPIDRNRAANRASG
jgi:hypothetical protein